MLGEFSVKFGWVLELKKDIRGNDNNTLEDLLKPTCKFPLKTPYESF